MLYSNCCDDVVKLTAADMVGVFPLSLWRTKSMELKVFFAFLMSFLATIESSDVVCHIHDCLGTYYKGYKINFYLYILHLLGFIMQCIHTDC